VLTQLHMKNYRATAVVGCWEHGEHSRCEPMRFIAHVVPCRDPIWFHAGVRRGQWSFRVSQEWIDTP
jgi:hypothetical protein